MSRRHPGGGRHSRRRSAARRGRLQRARGRTVARSRGRPAVHLDNGGIFPPAAGTLFAGLDHRAASRVPRACPDGRTDRAGASAATYLGAGERDEATGVDIGAACTVVIGGRFTGGTLLAKAKTLAGGGAGAIVRLDARGRQILSATRIAGTVSDLEVRPSTGDIAVATDSGVQVLGPDAAQRRWQTTGAVDRVAIGSAGTVAALSGTTVRVYGPSGRPAGTIRLAGRTVADVAVDDRTGSVLVTGFSQRGGPCGQVQIPFVHAYRRTGTLRWKLYDYAADKLGRSCADSRRDRIAVGRDGMVYLAGEMAGGTTVFTSDGQSAAATGPNVGYDKFTEATNTSSAHLTYVARIDPDTGTVRAGQMLLARIDTKGDHGNTITPRAITADAQGRIYVGGSSAYQIADRAALSMNGHRLKPYAGGDAWVLVTTPDLHGRLLWTVWTDGGRAEVRGLAVDGPVAAVAARTEQAPMYTTSAVQNDSSGAGSGYAAVWPARR